MSSSGWRRPRGAARRGENQLRNAFSALDMQRTADSRSDSSDDREWPTSLCFHRLPLYLSPTPFVLICIHRVSTGLDVCTCLFHPESVCLPHVYAMLVHIYCLPLFAVCCGLFAVFGGVVCTAGAPETTRNSLVIPLHHFEIFFLFQNDLANWPRTPSSSPSCGQEVGVDRWLVARVPLTHMQFPSPWHLRRCG